jgi:hypothetical protein
VLAPMSVAERALRENRSRIDGSAGACRAIAT